MTLDNNKIVQFYSHLFLLLTFISTVICSCDSGTISSEYINVQGNSMGTTYSIIYKSPNRIDYRSQIDSLLKEVNLSLSTYIDSSIISKVNHSSIEGETVDQHFINVFDEAKKVFKKTDGALDPTVMPLVNAWGFGHQSLRQVDSSSIDSMMKYIGFSKVILQQDTCKKEEANVQLTFSAIAKGYGVDVIADFFDSQEVDNYMIEIGGEIKVHGVNEHGEKWKIGIDVPVANKISNRKLQAVVNMRNESIATSGNYRNYKVVQGKKIVHTINPRTGYPQESNLLSASVFAKNCITADAYATAIMVMGFTKGKQLVEADSTLEAYFIYSDELGNIITYATSGVEKRIINLKH